jgi:hypothetical protein
MHRALTLRLPAVALRRIWGSLRQAIPILAEADLASGHNRWGDGSGGQVGLPHSNFRYFMPAAVSGGVESELCTT